jgi:xylulokinase
VREDHAITWPEFSHALASTPPGNEGRIMVPWFSPEITPPVSAPGVHRYGPAAGGLSDVRAVIEGQMLSMALHSRWMVSRVETIHAAGGAAVNREILQVMADVFGTRVFQMPVGNSAALGAALRAAHAHMLARNEATRWADVITGLAEPLANSRVDPDPDRHALYRDMVSVYAASEAHALGRGPDPELAGPGHT